MPFFDPEKSERLKSELDVAAFMAVKNIFHRKAMLLMIISIIGLGFLSTLFSSAIILGLKFTIEQKVITGAIGHIIIQPAEDKDFIANVKEVEKKALSVPGVVAVSPRIDSYLTIIDTQGTKITAPVRIIDPEKEYYTTSLHSNILDGKYLSASSAPEMLIGAELTKKYRMIGGSDAVDVSAGQIVDTAMEYNGVRINPKIKIRGIYGQHFMFTDGFVYMSRKSIEALFNVSDQDIDVASVISVKAVSRGHEDQIKNDLQSLGIDARVYKWSEKLGMLNQFIDSLMIISRLTAVIGVIIAFATIYIMVFINVLQKRSQIGIMKAIGITENTILFSYIIQSVIYGILGTLAGILLTKAVLGYIDLNPIDMPLGMVRPVTDALTYLYSSLMLLGSALVAGYMASKGVIREKILDAIFKG